MPERNATLLLQDILNCINHVQEYTRGFTYDTFSQNFMVTEACLYNLQVIGEAVAKLPDTVKEQSTHIPWKLIKGMRNRLIHDYFGTDLELVWTVIAVELPQLKPQLEKLLFESGEA